MPKRMVIFSISVGHGHHQVSRAIKEEWEDRGYEAEIVDIFSYMKNSHASLIRQAYFNCINRLPKLWDWTYHVTNLSYTPIMLSACYYFLWKSLYLYCKERKFDVIVTTHPLATQVGLFIKKKQFNRPKVFAVLTDFSTHKMSISKGLDAMFIAEKSELLTIKRNGIPVYSYGIPLIKRWDESRPRETLRRVLKLPDNQYVIVVSGGGEGYYCKKLIMELLNNNDIPAHVIWFMGKSVNKCPEPLTLTNGTTIRFLPFCENYSEYVKAADFFISKPGGVSMAEAIRWKIPTGILSPLPGQEKVNQTVLVKYPNIVVLNSKTVLSKIIEELNSEETKATFVEPSRTKIIDKLIEHIQLAGEECEKEETKKGFSAIFSKKQWSS
ncbi:MGDG synthase family glycosyltransferase [Evansella cellulosilytica]|uniref:Monogalactosyldiacylglycerol synthase n=1 Tax=Evansella cellulosilytica (strain ATCC 21833 / DSM 2522 / FERM P-1141 / JCM 9156 / N-4) TaxID=649639 RepID=E6TVD0_EVAC2|nr:glycosyltransferase [Evansella cellulosilytica]ADU30947.1 Monogalactosyldiacylglycerol synthase [Evansella cellulosilytica DSM 2522]